jgi:hypothetical protein
MGKIKREFVFLLCRTRMARVYAPALCDKGNI